MDAEILEHGQQQQTTADRSQQAFAFVQKVAADLSGDQELELPGFPDVVI